MQSLSHQHLLFFQFNSIACIGMLKRKGERESVSILNPSLSRTTSKEKSRSRPRIPSLILEHRPGRLEKAHRSGVRHLSRVARRYYRVHPWKQKQKGGRGKGPPPKSAALTSDHPHVNQCLARNSEGKKTPEKKRKARAPKLSLYARLCADWAELRPKKKDLSSIGIRTTIPERKEKGGAFL